MIDRFFDRLIERWCFSIAKHLMQEAKEAEYKGYNTAASVLIGIASALNKADGKIA